MYYVVWFWKEWIDLIMMNVFYILIRWIKLFFVFDDIVNSNEFEGVLFLFFV